METKNMINLKKGATVQTILSTLVIGIFVFSALYLFVSANETQVGITQDASFANAYASVNTTQKSLNEISSNFQNFSDAVREADPTDFGYYGFKGTLAIMKLPFSIIGMATGFMSSVLNAQNIIPPMVIYAILAIITFIIIFAAVSFLTNRGKDST